MHRRSLDAIQTNQPTNLLHYTNQPTYFTIPTNQPTSLYQPTNLLHYTSQPTYFTIPANQPTSLYQPTNLLHYTNQPTYFTIASAPAVNEARDWAPTQLLVMRSLNRANTEANCKSLLSLGRRILPAFRAQVLTTHLCLVHWNVQCLCSLLHCSLRLTTLYTHRHTNIEARD